MPGENERTVVAAVRTRPPEVSTAALEDAIARAEEQRRLAPDMAATAALAFFRGAGGACRARVHVVRHRPDEPQALVLGRHTECDLAELPDASLRHALVLVWPEAEGGATRFQCLDLRTPVGLALGEERVSEMVATEGQLAVGVGSAVVLVRHAAPGVPLFEEPEALASALTQAASAASLRPHRARPGVQVLRLDETHVSRSVARYLSVEVPPPDGGTRVSVVGRVGGGPVTFRVPPARLEEGVLLGRYRRCQASEVLEEDTRISRVHACLLAREGRRYVVDCGSTNGTFVEDPERDAPVELGPGRRLWPATSPLRLWLWEQEVLVVDA